jgi:enoyl-CoA hydratase/carnithine racemase
MSKIGMEFWRIKYEVNKRVAMITLNGPEKLNAFTGIMRDELIQAFDQERLMTEAQELAQDIADNTSAVSVALSRQLLWRMLGVDHPMEAHRIDSKCMYYMGKSEDAKEGVASFREKRQATFEMKPSKDMPDFYPWWKGRPFK